MRFENQFDDAAEGMKKKFEGLSLKKAALWGGSAVAALTVALGSPFTIDKADFGVVTRNGAFDRVVEPGLHFKIPLFEKVESHPSGIITVDTEGKSLNTLTIDSQQIDNAKLRIQFRLPTTEEGIKKMLKETKGGYTELMGTDGVNSFKEIAGKFNSLDIAGKRGELAGKTKENLATAAMAKYGITVVDTRLSDVNLKPEYMQAVEQAAMAKTLVSKARELQQKEQIDADTAKIKAAGVANAAIEAARGEAESTTLKATAEARRIDLEGQALARNPSVLQLRQIEQWGAGGAQVPNVLTVGSGGGATQPFMSLFPSAPANLTAKAANDAAQQPPAPAAKAAAPGMK